MIWYFRAIRDFPDLALCAGDLVIVEPGVPHAILLARAANGAVPRSGELAVTLPDARRFHLRRLPPNYGLVGLAEMDGYLTCLNPCPSADASPWRLAVGDRHLAPASRPRGSP